MFEVLDNLSNIEVKLIFCYSKSRFYNEVVETAKQASNYSETIENGILRHIIILKKTTNQDIKKYSNDFLIVSKLIKYYISEWKGVQIFYNGIEGSKKRLINAYHCYIDSLESLDTKNYCTENDDCPFLCKWCKILLTSEISTPKDNFYEIDHNITPFCILDKDGIFHVDKNLLVQELSKEFYGAALCPNLDFEKLKEIIAEFPNSINPKINQDWEVCFDYENKVVGIRKKRQHSFNNNINIEMNNELNDIFKEMERIYGEQ